MTKGRDSPSKRSAGVWLAVSALFKLIVPAVNAAQNASSRDKSIIAGRVVFWWLVFLSGQFGIPGRPKTNICFAVKADGSLDKMKPHRLNKRCFVEAELCCKRIVRRPG